MPNAAKWETTWTSRGNVLSTELNDLADTNLTAAGTEVDNSTNLDTYGCLEINADFTASPTAKAPLLIYMVSAPDGTNYHETETGNNEAIINKLCASVSLSSTDANNQRLITDIFELPPAKIKFILENQSDVAFAASGSTVELFTNNLEMQ